MEGAGERLHQKRSFADGDLKFLPDFFFCPFGYRTAQATRARAMLACQILASKRVGAKGLKGPTEVFSRFG